jgi:hypothetical protein
VQARRDLLSRVHATVILSIAIVDRRWSLVLRVQKALHKQKVRVRSGRLISMREWQLLYRVTCLPEELAERTLRTGVNA